MLAGPARSAGSTSAGGRSDTGWRSVAVIGGPVSAAGPGPAVDQPRGGVLVTGAWRRLPDDVQHDMAHIRGFVLSGEAVLAAWLRRPRPHRQHGQTRSFRIRGAVAACPPLNPRCR
jgi:hypothetical protein